ncbi:MAG TPA: protein translocase subunit SecD [Clostridiales bacterium]|nr:protein translocase subunit SecD [Clostridiales bacterium]
MKSRKIVFFIVFAIAILMTYVAINGLVIPLWSPMELVIPGTPDMRYGIDIRGGVDAAFEPVDLDRNPTKQELDSARAIIETRLDNLNILDRDVTVDEQNGYIIVRFPWQSTETDFDPEKAIAELGETAMLTFRNEADEVLVTGSHVVNASVGTHPQTGKYIVQLEFNEEGTKLFSDATKELVGKPINIYMDDTLIQSAIVQNHIPNGEAFIEGMSGIEEAKALSDKINAGALPFSLTSRNHSTISPSLGSGALNTMVIAGAIAFLVICILLVIYYRLPGFVACISLLIQMSGVLLALSVPQITLTLTGIAGVILSIGMGVDANIIISERISEDIKAGKSLSYAISLGFKNSFSSVFDGNITMLLVGVILMALGSGSLLSFAYTLITGIVFNFVAGVTASRLMIYSLSQFKFLRKPRLYTCLSKRVTMEKFTDFFSKRRVFLSISLAVILIGLIMSFVNGVRLDIQFKGGSLVKYNYVGEVDPDRAAEITSGIINRVVSAQTTTNLNTDEKQLVINIAGDYGLDVREQEKVDEALKAEFPDADLNLSESSMVEPFFGKKFLANGIKAIALGAVAILIYVWFRFRRIGGLSAGLMALAAICMDLFVVYTVHIIYKLPIGDSFVAVFLTIIGYSINDTIVVYDRIRENSKLHSRESIETITNLSIAQTLGRTINTSVAVFISVALVFVTAAINGIESVQIFALPMALGVVSGCYTSVCLVGPLWVALKKRQGTEVRM